MDKYKKVVQGLETCIPMKYETLEDKECRHELCPYSSDKKYSANGCFWDLMEEALELLNEQRTEIEQLRNDANARRCKDCGHRFDGKHLPNCCELLMAKTGWIVEIPVSDDWYCADFYPSDESVLEAFAEDG